MKRVLLIVLAFSCLATTAFAQAGAIVPSGDAAVTSDIIDTGGLVQVYIVHVYTPGATAAQLMLDAPAGWIHLGDTWNFSTVIGTSITGVSVAYGACLPSPIVLGMVNFFGAAVPACTPIRIVADPTAPSGLIEGVDCSTPAVKTFPMGGMVYVNPDSGCISPVEDKTWGGVKALYR